FLPFSTDRLTKGTLRLPEPSVNPLVEHVRLRASEPGADRREDLDMLGDAPEGRRAPGARRRHVPQHQRGELTAGEKMGTERDRAVSPGRTPKHAAAPRPGRSRRSRGRNGLTPPAAAPRSRRSAPAG